MIDTRKPHLIRKNEEQKKWKGNKLAPIKRRCLGIKSNGEDCRTEFEDPVFRLCQSCRSGSEGINHEYGVHL